MDTYYSEENSLSVFKSYLRGLLNELKDLRNAINKDDKERVQELLERLIDNTQKEIED